MKKRILIVDDSPMIHEMFGDRLEDAGFEVLHAEDGFSAINTALVEMPDLILLDIMMPIINGYQVCRLLKDRKETSHIPIMFVTGKSSKNFVDDPMNWGFKTGADGYLDKADGDRIVECIKPLLEGAVKKGSKGKASSGMSEMEILSAISRLLDKQLYLDVKRLEELDEKKNAFVSNVSHELRSPLGIIKGNMQNLMVGVYGDVPDKQREMLASTDRTVSRIARIVGDLLDLSRIEAGAMQLDREFISLSELVDMAVEDYAGELKGKGIVVQKDFAFDLPEVFADRDRLMQVIVNLLSNAIKFTPKGGLIRISLGGEADVVRFEIEDTGPGVPAQYLEKIFDKFERITADKVEGTGLGLPIAKDLVLLHGGKIWAESDEGAGSKFIFTVSTKNKVK
jgi:two-component system, sensor histidine kinase and response regulator